MRVRVGIGVEVGVQVGMDVAVGIDVAMGVTRGAGNCWPVTPVVDDNIVIQTTRPNPQNTDTTKSPSTMTMMVCNLLISVYPLPALMIIQQWSIRTAIPCFKLNLPPRHPLHNQYSLNLRGSQNIAAPRRIFGLAKERKGAFRRRACQRIRDMGTFNLLTLTAVVHTDAHRRGKVGRFMQVVVMSM